MVKKITRIEQWELLAKKSNFNAKHLSIEMNVSQRQLQRYSLDLFGCSPQKWLDRQRLTLALGLLKNHYSVKAAAFCLGFKQPSHFSRKFRAYYGISPKQSFKIKDSMLAHVAARNVHQR